MGSSLSKGLSEYLPGIAGVPYTQTHHDVYLGHVISVIKDENSEYYDGPETIGAILVKKLAAGYNKSDKSANIFAYPLDRGNYTMPLAGEQVWGCIFMGPDTKLRYYYVATVSTDQTAAAIINPFLGADPTHLRQDGYLTPAAAEKRFDEKNGYTAAQLKSKATQEKIREGDKVLEGKFGGVIKFTHTITKDGVWNQNYQISNLNEKGTGILSKDGDPLLIIKSAQRSATPGFEDDDINADESSLYLATSQNIPLQLNCSKTFRSFEFPDPIVMEIDAEPELNTSGLAKMFGGGYDPNAKVAIKVQGSLQLSLDGSLASSLDRVPSGDGESTSLNNVLIGDSQTPTVARFTKKAKLIDPEGKGEKPQFLQKTGWTLKQLDDELKNFTPSPNVKNVIVCIGTNDGYTISVQPQTFYTHLKTAFPSATGFYMIQGSWGWGSYLVAAKRPEYGSVQKPSFFVTYYQKFQAAGFTLIEPPIGYWDEGHPGTSTPSFKDIGAAIDNVLR